MGEYLGIVITAALVIIVAGILVLLVKCYRKVPQGTALIRTGMGGARVTTSSGIIVIPVLHRAELMDISVKRIEIARQGEQGLICRDNLRADIQVAFFVRVNNTPQDILQVAQSLGCARASEQSALVELFDAKFSEALKTVGKQFDFVSLYNDRDQFKEQIIRMIGTDLNGYVLDDSAIDYLEQTPLEKLDPNNILDSEGIKKITDLTAQQQILANKIKREKEKVITKQDVEAREAILELEKQQAEAEERQRREIASIQAREHAEAEKVRQEERLKSERARLETEEEVQVREQNVQRQVLVAEKNKMRTEAVENERIERDRDLEATERQRLVALAQIERDKAIEVEKKNIQDVIRERVMVERSVVEEEERIKDTREFASAERAKSVAVTQASQRAEEVRITEVQAAQAKKEAASLLAEQVIIQADAKREAADRDAAAVKVHAEARIEDEAAPGLAEARVLEARASALEKQGETEAKVLSLKFHAEADGILEKAAAMKQFDAVGRDHEEFRLQLDKDREVALESIRVHREVAQFQAETVGKALQTATIDIVGGDTAFFDRIVGAVSTGKAVDRAVLGSEVLTDVKDTFFSGDPEDFRERLQGFVSRFGVGSEDLKNLSVAALVGRLLSETSDDGLRGELRRILTAARSAGVADVPSGRLRLRGSDV